MKRVILVFLLFIVVGCTAFGGFQQGFIRFNYPSQKRYPVRGIDVSHHQGKIDWETLSKENLQFAFIKATEGGDFKDTEFLDNWLQAKKNNLHPGAYHFFTFCKPGKEQARNFLDTVPKDIDSLPPVLDFEFGGNCKARPAKEELIKEVRDWLTLIEQEMNKKPIFYVTYSSYYEYLEGEINGYPIWIRDIFFQPRLRDGNSWVFWQYANRGRLQGIEGPVDLNVFGGNQLEFIEFIQRKSS